MIDRVRERIGLVLGRGLVLGTLAERLARVHGDRRLVTEHESGRTLTFTEAAALVDRWAGAVAAQVPPGGRVVLATPNGYDQLLLCLAVSRAGAVAVPVNAQMRPDEINHVVADSAADLVVRSADELAGGEPLGAAVGAEPGAIAALFYTSGTTGKPKGVELTHISLVGSLGAIAALPTALRRDEAVFGLPIAHIMGFTVTLGLAVAGIPAYFLRKFNPVTALDAIEQERATIFCGVPAMYRMLLEAGAEERDLSSVRVWLSGADAMPAELVATFKRFGAIATLPLFGAVGEASFAEGYGMVETGGGVAVKVSPPFMTLGGGESVGRALPGNKFRVVDEDGKKLAPGQVGELQVKGRGVLRGYHGSPKATAEVLTEDGWLRTGDLARMGFGGTVMFVGRHKDVIKHGGYSVYAVEVEQVLEGHSDVVEASVIAIDDPKKGEMPAAVVRLTPGTDLAALDLGSWAGERLSKYKVPQRFVAVDELPRSGTDKVQKETLRDLFD
jgi:acyl-CoA synthetase (AMP-forming)/AMP-acid ligase II